MTRLALIALLAAASLAHAQAPTRVRGPVEAVRGDVLVVKAPGGGTVDLLLGEKTQYVFMQPIALEDIKPGDFLGVTSNKRPDGSLVAVDVRRFAKPVNPGHRPFDGRDDQTMTNASVSATVQASAGRELTMTYEGGTQKIAVPASAYLSTLVPGNRAQIQPGWIVSVLVAPSANGPALAQQIQYRAP